MSKEVKQRASSLDRIEGRGRRGSGASIQELFKRKREELEKEVEVFERSKKTARSPSEKDKNITRKEDFEDEEMDELKKLILSIRKDIKEDLREIKEENRMIREDFKRMREEWSREKEGMESRIEVLEQKLKKSEERELARDRKERRNNLVVTGGRIDVDKRGPMHLKEEIKRLLDEKQVVGDAKIMEAIHMAEDKNGGSIVLIKMESWEEKMKVIRRKGNLKGTNIYIEDDLPPEDRTLQKLIRRKVMELRQKGEVAKVGYKKINIAGKWVPVPDESKLQGM